MTFSDFSITVSKHILMQTGRRHKICSPFYDFKPSSKNIFTDRSKAVLLLWIIFCYSCFVFFMLPCLFIAALWSHAGKELTSSLCVIFSCDFVTFTCCVLGQVWYLIESIPDFTF